MTRAVPISGLWRSPVAHLVRIEGVRCSNPLSSTTKPNEYGRSSALMSTLAIAWYSNKYSGGQRHRLNGRSGWDVFVRFCGGLVTRISDDHLVAVRHTSAEPVYRIS